MARFLFVLLAVVVGAACSGPGVLAPTSDLGKTWLGAAVALPPQPGEKARVASMARAFPRKGEIETRTPAGRALRQYPVVVYLHGCTGLGTTGRAFMAEMAGRGYVVVAPNSMARKFRPLQCDPRTKTGGHNLYVYEFRLAEVAFALERIREAPWADPDNLFLVGVSEGGVAAALYRGDGFRARVILQWTCHGGSLVRGIAAPADSPILAVVRGRDPWYDPARTSGQQGDCGAFLGKRPNSDSIVLGDGAGHGVLGDQKVMSTVVDFIVELTARD
ncbi:MAG: dienelactone hydrolase family protein [Sphingomonadales bacterium]